jgi:hypothetical protein
MQRDTEDARDRLKARFDAWVEDGLLGYRNGYYYVLDVPKRQCRDLIRALWLISKLVRDFEQRDDGYVVTVLDRFDSPTWTLE